MYATDAYKSIQDLCKMYPSFNKLLYTFCIKRTIAAKFWKQFVYKSFSKCWIHFVHINSDLQKVYIIEIMYAISIQNSNRMYIQKTVCIMDPTC